VATHILGISAFYHDSAAALVRDGEIVAAAQEERFTREKHDHRFPTNAIEYCLSEAGITPADLDAVTFYDKPFLKFERLLETYLAYAPRGLRSFMQAMPLWLKQKLFLPREIDRGLGNEFTGPIYFTLHHESHAASAFLPSPFEEAAILTLDGVGEWATTTWGVGSDNRVELKQEVTFPHSLGLLYSAMTYYLGFKVNSGEYKVMGLAPYGEPKYASRILNNILDVKEDGSFWLNQRYFNYSAGLTMTNDRFHDLFEGPPRSGESELTQRHMDLAASVQRVTEEVMLRIAKHVHAKTGLDNLCMAGGVALNCVGNGRVLREGPFKKIWIQPAAGDAGGALGAALFTWHQIMGKPRTVVKPDNQHASYLGPRFENDAITTYLDSANAKYTLYENEDDLCTTIAQLLDEGKVVGHFAGRMEFGPRALGARSILGDARNTDMQSTMNLKVKFRESFRPFAPSCLEDKASEYFEIDQESPYMLLVAPVQEGRRQSMTDEQAALFGIEKLNVPRSDVPAITHVDYSARVQTVSETRTPRYYRILKAFEERTGCGLIVNTSFNIRGEPIVGTPEDAYKCFMFTDMDALVLEDCICLKVDQPPLAGAEEHKKQFKLD
jgi:carbamoyltransferase